MSTYIVGVPYHIFAFSDFTALLRDNNLYNLQFVSPQENITLLTIPSKIQSPTSSELPALKVGEGKTNLEPR